jgi:hypothetical protein
MTITSDKFGAACRCESGLGRRLGPRYLSPLLANVALHRLDEAWRAEGRRLGVLVRYADLCGDPHRSAYAESRVMPSGVR